MSEPLHHPFLVGDRVFLRGLERADITGPWLQWFNDAEVTRYMYRGAFPNSVEGHTDFYESVVKGSGDLVLAICDKTSQEHIGNVGLHRIDWISRIAEFGIVIGSKVHWGKGAGTEATRLIVGHGFSRLNLHKIFLGVHADHVSAIRAYERAGFHREALVKGEIYRDGRYFDKVLMAAFAPGETA
jgi:ribosomal-protein-alanine N-acetyltransferase